MTDQTTRRDDKNAEPEVGIGGGTLDGKVKDAGEDPAFGHALEDQKAGVGANLTGK